MRKRGTETERCGREVDGEVRGERDRDGEAWDRRKGRSSGEGERERLRMTKDGEVRRAKGDGEREREREEKKINLRWKHVLHIG